MANNNFPGYTTNAEIDEWVDKCEMGYFAGWVMKWLGASKATNNCLVAKAILNNNEGTQLQVVAWGPDNISRLKAYSDSGTLLIIDGGLTRDLSNYTKFNEVNVNWELRITSNTILTPCGKLEPESQKNEIFLRPIEKLASFNGECMIEGHLLNPIRLLISKDKKYGLGSIVDGIRKLELKIINFNAEDGFYKQGQKIRVRGSIHRRWNPMTKQKSPAYFEIESEEHLIRDEENDITDAVEINNLMRRQYAYLK